MSSYGSSYVSRFSTGRNSTSPASTTSSVDRSRTSSSYGSLPRSYGSSRTAADCRSPTRETGSRVSSTTYGGAASYAAGGSAASSYAAGGSAAGRFTPRGYSSDRAPERPKSPDKFKYTPLETAALRMGSSSRFGGQIARSPISDKTPNVFGISPVSEVAPTPFGSAEAPSTSEPIQVTLVTRSTSPTPPCNSSFLRARRADMDRLDIQTVSKPNYRPVCVTSETQTDDGKKTTSWGSRLSAASTSAPSTAAARGYRGYIRPGDLPSSTSSSTSSKSEQPERKDVVSRVGGLSLNRPTDLPLSKANSFVRDSRSPSYKSPSETSTNSRTNSNSEANKSQRNFLTPKTPDPPTRSPSKCDLKPKPDPPTQSKSDSKPNFLKNDSSLSSKSELPKSPSKTTVKPPKPAPQTNLLKKSTTTTSVQPVPNKDFRKSVLNMDLSKKASSSSSESSSSEESTSSSEESSDEEPKSNDSKYLTASRTTAQMSSADEVSSISLDRPPKPPGKNETKSVVVKSTSTATPMKVQFSDSGKEDAKKPMPLRRFDSGQRDWWLSSGSDKNSSEKPANGEAVQKSDIPSQASDNGEKKMFKLRKFDSGQADWWKSSKDVPSLSNSEQVQNAKVNDSTSSSYQKLPKMPSSASISKSGVSLHNIPSSVSLDKSDEPVVNLNKTPSSSSLGKSPSSLSLPKVPSDLSIGKTGSFSSLPTDEDKNGPPSKPGLARTRSSASLQKPLQKSPNGLQKAPSVADLSGGKSPVPSNGLPRTPSNASLPKVPSNASLNKSGSNASLNKSGSNSSLQKTDSNLSLNKTGSSVDLNKTENGGILQKAPSGLNLSKTPSGLNLAKTPSGLNLAKTPSGLNLAKTPSGLNLAKTPSSANLAAKPPISNISKTDAKEVLEAKEHTPAFNRLHKRYAAEPRRRLVRVESGERDWWLSDEEKTEQKTAARPSEVLGKVYCGLYTNIDQVLGSQAPPPCAFNTPDHSSDSDTSDDEFWVEVKPSDVIVHEPIIQPEGMIKRFFGGPITQYPNVRFPLKK